MNEIKVHVFHTGEVCVDPSIPFKNASKNPIAFTGLFRNPHNRIWLPVSSYLIEHPKGLILYDTGWSTEVRTDPKKHLTLKHYLVNQPKLPEGKAITEQLEKIGIYPKDIDYVVMSHMDSDHVSGVKLVKDAKNIIVSNLEMEDTRKYKLRYIKSMWDNVPITEFEFNNNKGPFNRSYDLFNDGSIELINIPGHSDGLAAMKITNEDGKFVLLFSDGGYAERSWKELISPGITLNSDETMKSLEWIKKMSLDKNCIESLANHDVDIKPHIIRL